MLKTIIKKTGKVLGIGFGALLVLFLALWTALQHPAIQRRVARQITKSLSERLDTRFSIDRISIGFFSRAVVEGLYVEDELADTLLYAGRVSVSLGPFSIFGKKLNVKGIGIDDVRIHLKRNPLDSSFNFQYIIAAFSSPSPADTVPSPWKFSIGKITVQNTKLTLDDPISRFLLDTEIGILSIRINDLDIAQQKLDVRRIDLASSTARYESRVTNETIPPEVPSPSGDIPLSFPYSGWDLKVRRIALAGNRLIFNKNNKAPIAGRIDFSNFDISGLGVNIAGLEWTADRLAANIEKLSFTEQSGFILHRLAAEFNIDQNAVTVRNFLFETPQSRLQAGLALRYSSFSDLPNFVEKTRIEAEFPKSHLSPEDVQYLSGALDAMPFLDFQPADRLDIQGKITGPVNNLKLENLSLKLADALHIQCSGEVESLADPAQLKFRLQLEELSATYRPLVRRIKSMALPSGVENFGRIRLSGQFEGRLDDWGGRNVRIETEANSFFQGDLRVRDITDIDRALFDLEIVELTTRGGDIQAFLEAPLPIPLDSLGAITYSGRFIGGIRDFALDGILCTGLGDLEQDMQIRFNQDYSNAEYSGTIRLDDLDLGVLLNSPEQFGRIGLSARFEGNGLHIDSLSTQLDAVINHLEFNRYEYSDIKIDGRFDRRMFAGRTSAKDENLAFSFNGLVDLNDSLPDLRFVAAIDALDLHRLHFYPTPLVVSAGLDVNLKGNHPDNLTGKAAIVNLDIADDTTRYGAERITLEARRILPAGREITLKSEILQARIAGNFHIRELPKSLAAFAGDFFPVQLREETGNSQTDTIIASTPPAQDFELEITLSDPVRLSRFFIPGLSRLDTAHFTAEFDTRSGKFDLDGYVPIVEYGGMRVDSMRLCAFSSGESLNGNLSVKSILSGGQEVASLSTISADMGQDSLRLELASLTAEEEERLHLTGIIVPAGDKYRMQLNSPLALNGKEWNIPEQNRITFGGGFLDVQQFRLQRNGQSFYAQSRAPQEGRPFAPLEIGFEKFRIREIGRLVNLEEDFLDGILDGKVVISKPDSALYYQADIRANDLKINQALLGDLTVRAEPVTGRPFLQVFTQLQGSENQFAIDGRYGLENKEFQLKVDLQKLQMKFLDAFLPGIIRDSRGRLAADLTVSGTLEQPAIEGAFRLDSVGTFVEYLKGRYDFGSHSIAIGKKAIDFGRMQLRDESGQTAFLGGKILHQNFKDFQFDLRFNTSKFQFLNTKAGDNPLFYGKVLLDTDVEMRGSPSLPRIRINAKTLPGTTLTAQAVSSEAAIAQEDFVLFGRPDDFEADTAGISRAPYRAVAGGFELLLNLQILPEAEFQVVIDPATGDKLICRGTANLTIEMDPSGALSTVGTYTIDRGSYSLNYENVIRRSFQIRRGSRIDLLGDPMDSRFDVTAIYTAGAPLLPLIQNQVGFLTDAQRRELKRRADVQVLLQLKGDLSQPEISFDIQVPETGQNAIDNAVTRKMTQLREQENELNKQVFGLLVFNNFISEESSVVDLAGTGENIALSSVSNFISSQLNNLASRYVKGVDISFGVESYRTQFDGQGAAVTELEVQLSKQLFNERLSIQVGGNFDLSPEDSRRQDNGFGFAGDFLLEYKLTESGAYRLRVFRRSDYDLLRGNETETGVGLIFKKSFGGTMRQKNTKPKAKE